MSQNKKLEEAAVTYAQTWLKKEEPDHGNKVCGKGAFEGFQAGAQWQRQRAKVLEEALETAHENACQCCDSKDSVQEHCQIAISEYRGEE